MIQINKVGNTIVVDFTDNDKYLNNGKIEVAPNELMVVIDDSEMATFKKMSNGDTLFGQLIDQIQIQGENVTKDNIIEKFGAIGFSVEAVSSVNGQTGDVVITPESLNVYNKTEVDAALANKQVTLVSGTNIKTINGESILGNGNLVIQSGWDDIQGKPQFARVATSGDYNDLINKPTIPDVSNLATKEEIADMETKSNAAATYATKDEIPSLAGYLTETAASETYATKQELGNKLNTATYNSEKAGFETKENAAATYQVKGDYATKSEIPTATSQLTNDSGFITEIPSEYITETELSSSLNSKADSANVYTKTEIDNMIGQISARLDQINGAVY